MSPGDALRPGTAPTAAAPTRSLSTVPGLLAALDAMHAAAAQNAHAAELLACRNARALAACRSQADGLPAALVCACLAVFAHVVITSPVYMYLKRGSDVTAGFQRPSWSAGLASA